MPDDPSPLAGAVSVVAWLAVLLSGVVLLMAAMDQRLSVALTRTRVLAMRRARSALLPTAAVSWLVYPLWVAMHGGHCLEAVDNRKRSV